MNRISDRQYQLALRTVALYIEQKAHEIVPDARDLDALREADVLPDILNTVYIDIDSAIESEVAKTSEIRFKLRKKLN